jgi:hypothetical protein
MGTLWETEGVITVLSYRHNRTNISFANGGMVLYIVENGY